MKKFAKRALEHDFVRYAFVGLASTVLDVLILKILSSIGVYLWLSVALGFTAGTINGYFLNSRWTFRYKTAGQEGLKFGQFTVVSLIGLVLTELIVLAYVRFGAHYLTMQSITVLLDSHKWLTPTFIGKGIAVVVVFFWNYFANKHWTFRKV